MKPVTFGGFTSMDKNPITPRSHEQMIREYPITGLLDGWYFRTAEVSNGCYLIEGCDIYGRKISRRISGDPDAVLRECVEYARSITQQSDTTA